MICGHFLSGRTLREDVPVESSFYPEYERQETPPAKDPVASMLKKINENPDWGRQLLQSLLLGATVKRQSTQDKSF